MNTTEELKLALKANLTLFTEYVAIISTFTSVITITGYSEVYIIDFLESAKGINDECDYWLDTYIQKYKKVTDYILEIQ